MMENPLTFAAPNALLYMYVFVATNEEFSHLKLKNGSNLNSESIKHDGNKVVLL